ncbi:hypothetical protein MQE36_11720 [Zhouia spongiae]|uniref:Uncharacterized protein n=1 Tax=Zhouia spongiae TaxID=2202721 RepID=A0ABY3YIT9_9FLAO|nr:hypothetical protein [Zhouia spongiae]UNY97752.1 hypothetical protein MQE36_11720 [Zhouia spongiae]
MEIFRTFDEQYQGIYIAKFVNCPFYQTPNEYETELDKIQNELQDPLFVRNFIKSTNSGWKQGAFKNHNLTYLATDVLQESADLFDKLDELTEESQNGDCFDLLFDEFKELSKSERYDDPGRRKMYTYTHGSLIRLYGVLVGNNAIILTGAGIKLVDKMNHSKALKMELKKMTYLKAWLKQEKITDATEL